MNKQVYQARQAAGNINLPSTSVANPVNFTDVLTLTFTPDANAAYALFWYVEAGQVIGGGSSSDYHHFTLRIAGADLDIVHARQRSAASPFDVLAHAGVWVIPASSSPAATTITLRGGMGTASTRQQVARNARLIAVRLEARDTYAQSATRVEVQNGGLYTAASAPTPETGTYIVFGSAGFDGANASAGSTMYLSPGAGTTGQYSPSILQPPTKSSDTAYFVPAMAIGRSAAASAQANLNINGNGAVAYQGSRNHCVVAFYEADIPAVSLTQDLTAYSTPSPTAYELLYQPTSAPGAAGSRLTFGTMDAAAVGSANNDIMVRMLAGGTETHANQLRNFQASGTRGWFATFINYEDAVPAGREYRMEWYRMAGTSTTLNTPHRQFVAIDLTAPGGTVEPPAPERRPIRIGRFL